MSNDVKLSHFSWYASDWLGSSLVAGLTRHDRSVYFDILNHLFVRWAAGNMLPDDDATLGRMLALSPAQWRKTKAVLVWQGGPLHVENGCLTSDRLRREFEKAAARYENLVGNARKAHAARAGHIATHVTGHGATHGATHIATHMHRAGDPEPDPEDRTTEIEARTDQPARGEKAALAGAAPPSGPATSLGEFLAATWPDIARAGAEKIREFEAAQRAACPGVDLLTEARKARAWEAGNPAKAKVNHRAFLARWYAREQDRHATGQPPPRPSLGSARPPENRPTETRVYRYQPPPEGGQE